MTDQMELRLRRQLNQAAETIHPSTDLVSGARRRYRHRPTASVAAAAGATVAVAGLAFAAPAVLSHEQAGVHRAEVADRTAARSTTEQRVSPALEVSMSGYVFELPVGFRLDGRPVRTKLGPHERDINDLSGYSVVASASKADQKNARITLATYEGDVAVAANKDMSAPFHFGRDPSPRTSIAGHETWVSMVRSIPASAFGPKPGAPANAPSRSQLVRTAALPHVTIEVTLGPVRHLYLSTDGISEADALAIARSGLG